MAQAVSARAARTQFENDFGDALITYEQKQVRYLSDVTIHVDPIDAAGERYHKIAEHVHDGLPTHSH